MRSTVIPAMGMILGLAVGSALVIFAKEVTKDMSSHPGNGVRPYVRRILTGQELRDSCPPRLNDAMRYMGIDSVWSSEGDTIVMRGELCDEGFLETFPKLVRDDIVRSDFHHARCVGPRGDEHREEIPAE